VSQSLVALQSKYQLISEVQFTNTPDDERGFAEMERLAKLEHDARKAIVEYITDGARRQEGWWSQNFNPEIDIGQLVVWALNVAEDDIKEKELHRLRYDLGDWETSKDAVDVADDEGTAEAINAVHSIMSPEWSKEDLLSIFKLALE